MKTKIRRMIFLFFGFFLAWYALWFMLIAFYKGTLTQQGSMEAGVYSVVTLVSSLCFAIGLAVEEPAA